LRQLELGRPQEILTFSEACGWRTVGAAEFRRSVRKIPDCNRTPVAVVGFAPAGTGSASDSLDAYPF